jgi:hypothetical protein
MACVHFGLLFLVVGQHCHGRFKQFWAVFEQSFWGPRASLFPIASFGGDFASDMCPLRPFLPDYWLASPSVLFLGGTEIGHFRVQKTRFGRF